MVLTTYVANVLIYPMGRIKVCKHWRKSRKTSGMQENYFNVYFIILGARNSSYTAVGILKFSLIKSCISHVLAAEF